MKGGSRNTYESYHNNSQPKTEYHVPLYLFPIVDAELNVLPVP